MSTELSLLYAISIGTLLVASAATLWDRRFHAVPGRGLGFWAVGYALLAGGCLLLGLRGDLPAILGYAIGSTLIMSGYGCLLVGVAAFAGHRPNRRWAAGFAAILLVWFVSAALLSQTGWHLLGGVATSAICTAGAWILMRSKRLSPFRARTLGALTLGIHAGVYLLRLPVVLVNQTSGDASLHELIAIATMVEGIVFSAAAPMALMFLTREERESRLREEATTDFLTGLENRRGFVGKAEAFLGRHDRPSSQAALALFDLDHFKSINDRYGHSTGDRVIKIFAETLERTLRPQDVIGRMGGEEFAVLMPGRDVEAARQAAEAVRHRFAGAVSQSPDFAFAAGVSGGVVPASEGQNLHELLAEADRLLYLAKANGRNRIETAADPAPLKPAIIPSRRARTPRSPAAAA